MIYLFHGDDDLSRREAVRGLLPVADSDDYLAMSTFDGGTDVQHIIEACNTLPFLSTSRYVLVRNFIAANTKRRGGSDDDADAAEEPAQDESPRKRPVQVLRDYLAHMPDTTVLILEERGKAPSNSVLVKFAKEHGDEREFRPLEGAQLTRWIEERFAAVGTPVHPIAVRTLAEYVGANLLQLQQEIDKLSAYAGSEQVQQADVAEMVASAEETKVWDMIDAAAMGKPKEAVGQLRRLLADSANPPLRTLGAIVNRFRTMMLIKELVDQRQNDFAISKQTGVPDWSVRNTKPLVRNFTFDQLRAIYERLLDTDITLKSSPLDDKLTLELLVLDIATRNLSRSERATAVELSAR